MTSKTDLRPQVALITGAASGIGRSTARAFTGAGWSLVLAARSQQTTNLLGTANVARASLHHFRTVKAGHLVPTGSLLGKIALPSLGAYVIGKWGVHALARTLPTEHRSTPGIRISMISPGSVNTPAYPQPANYVGWPGRPLPPVDPPEKVARVALRILTAGRGRRDRAIGLANPLAIRVFRWFPGLYDRLVVPLMKVGGPSRRSIDPTTGSVFAPVPAGDAEHGRWDRLGRESL